MNISIDNPRLKFKEHLEKEENNRILFSGKFGTGKSHFLRQFFSVGEESNYNVFWISPVNYVVGNNQDIFEWIKIDIAKQLIANYIEPTVAKRDSDNFLIQSYVLKNASSIFSRLLTHAANQLVEKTTGIDFLDAFKKELEEFKTFKGDTEKQIETDFTKLAQIITESTLQKGSIFEDDLTTRIIRGNVELLKLGEQKQSILIIDDLDRLDPEHIFRILNILSCHNEHFDGNKFGFDKVIVVCDIHNVEVIYEHKYGKADFIGYIEKFYTYEPYYYSLKDSVIDYCIKNIVINDIRESSRHLLVFLLTIMVSENLLKVRNLSKIIDNFGSHNHPLDVKKYKVHFNGNSTDCFIENKEIQVDFNDFDFLRVVYFLSIAFGGILNLKQSLKKIKDRNILIGDFNEDNVIGSFAILYALSRGNTTGATNVFFDNTQNPNFSYSLKYPQFQFMGIPVKVTLKWNVGHHYSDGNYFDGARVHRNGSGNSITLDSLIIDLEHFLNFLIREKMFVNIKED